MASTPSDRLGLRLIGTGDFQDTWGSELNSDTLNLIDEGIAGVETIALSGDVTLSTTQYVSNQSRNRVLRFTNNSLSATPTVTLPATERFYIIHNALGGTYGITFSNGSATVSVAANITTALIWQTGSVLYGIDLATGADVATVAPQVTNGNIASIAAQIANSNIPNLAASAVITSMNALSPQAVRDDMALLAVADVINDMALLAVPDVISDMNTLAVPDVISDINTLATPDVVSDLNTLATPDIVADMNALAVTDVLADMAALAETDVLTDMATLAVPDIISDMNTLAVADVISDMNTLATADIVSDMNTLANADVIADMNTLATADIVADMNTLATADVVADMNTLGTADVVNDMNVLGTSQNVTNMNTLSGISSAITGVNAIASSVTAVNTDPLKSNINTTAGAITNVNNVGTNIASVNNVSSNISSVNSFGNTYQISTNNPTTGGDGSSSLADGMLAWVTSADKLRVYNATSGAWEDAGSAVNGLREIYQYVATANQTVFPATGTIAYDQTAGGAAISIFLNGVLLKTTDYTATNGTSVTLASGAALNDEVTIHTFGAFNVSDTYSRSAADALLAAKATNTDLATKAPLASPALTGSPTVNGVAIATGSTELGTLTQAFSAGQQTTINLSANALSPSVAVTKEVPQVGITNNQWNVNSSAPNYTRYNSAPATTLDFVGYDLVNASYEKSFAVNTQELGVQGLTFNADGTKMYVIGDSGDDVNQYALSTAWDIATASYEKVFSVSSQETVPQSVRFSPDGTRMFIAGDSWNAIFQYNLSTAFDVGTASYSNNTFSVASQDSSPHGLAFNNDGTKMFVVGGNNDTIYQYTLSTGFDLSTASYASVSFSVGPYESTPKGITFNADGTKLFMAGQGQDKIFLFNLSTGFDLSTISYPNTNLDVSSQNGNATDVAFGSGGGKMYMLGESGNIVYQYDLPLTLSLGSGSFAAADVAKTIEANNGKFILTATSGTFSTTTAPSNYNQVASGSWEMYGTNFDTVATDLELSHTFANAYANGVFSYTDNSALGNSISNPQGLCFGNNGTKFYIMCSSQQKIYEFNLSTPFDVTTRSLVNSFSTSSNFSQGSDFIITPDGTRIFLTQTQGGRIDTYELTTPFDITTCSNFALVRNMNSTDGESTPTGICFSPDGTNMYVTGTTGNRVYHLSLSTGYDPSSTIAMVSETSVGSIDATAITMKPDGTRFFIYSDSANAVKIYDTSTAFSFSSVGYTGQYTATNASSGRGLAFNDTGSQLNIIDTAHDYIYRYDTATLSAPSGYHAAHTTTSIDSTYWTDINSMTANETAGSGTVNYAVSTDDRTTWKIAHNTSGVRSIVKNDSGTWKYNSNATYGSETWTAGATNNELATIQEAMGTAQNRMDKIQLEAVSDANHFPLSNNLDLAIILNLSSGSGIPSSDGVSINYDAAVANQGAILGTDYNYDVPALNKVRITAVNAATLKVRVV
jgi:sugar lactone lactonase YvrE